jgi:hypothetical protein
LQVEHPVGSGDSAAFHFYPTLPRMLGATLIGHQVVQVGEPREKRLLISFGMMVTVEALVGFQGRACAESVQHNFLSPSLP